MNILYACLRQLVPLGLLMYGTAAVAAESLSVREMIGNREKWQTWIRDKTVLHISGRYEGRVAKQFRLEKLPALITPARTTVLPPALDGGKRLTVSGVLRKVGTRYYLDVNRIAVGATDLERLNFRADRVAGDTPEELYKLADEYSGIAEFYEDKDLTAKIRQIRMDAFGRQRIQRRNDPAALARLAARGLKLGISQATVDAIQFEALVVRLKSEVIDRKKLLTDVRRLLPGWDQHSVFADAAAEQRFLKNMVAEYEAADQLRRLQMHRRLYRVLRVPELLRDLRPDGSNGLEVAESLTGELPEEKREIARVRALYVEYRLSRVPDLTHPQLENLEALLRDAGRSAEFQATLTAWLKAQEKRLINGQLDGMMQMAEEYQFAWERWKQPQHRNAAADLLKRAWPLAEKAAPKEADRIAQQLDRLGWTRLRDRWIATADLKNLPRDDIDLAAREHRVVAGMTRDQVLNVLGEPTRTVRVVSARNVQEIWIFEEAGSTVITVQLQRRNHENPEQSVVIVDPT